MSVLSGPTCNITWCERIWSNIVHAESIADYLMQLERRDHRYLNVITKLDSAHTASFLDYGLVIHSSVIADFKKQLQDILLRQQHCNRILIFGTLNSSSKERRAELIQRDAIIEPIIIKYFNDKNEFFSKNYISAYPHRSDFVKWDLTRWEDD